jgi:twitching motility two-component system response regulator PilH
MPADPMSPALRHPRQRPLVLFIEGNLTQLDLYSLVLQPEVDVIQASRAMLGYALACQEIPDVIVVDVVLPDADGLALCQQLHANPQTAGIPILVLTDDDGAYARAQFARSDLTGVLMKPCSTDRLLAALREAVARVG